jgi:hypothetical protein
LAPTTSSPIYTGPIVVYGSSTPTTVEAVAIAPGYSLSAVGSATYTIPQVLPALVTPTPGTKFPGTTVTFDWTTGNVGATQYELFLSSVGVGDSDLYNSGAVTGTSATVTGLPSNGETIYATLSWYINGTWYSANYTYTAYGTIQPAHLITPTPGSTLSSTTVTFAWLPGNAATLFQLYVGTTGIGSSNLYNSGSVTATTETVSGLPATGKTLYVELSWYIGTTWYTANYTYTASGGQPLPALTTPTPGSTLTSTTVTFKWTTGTGGATHYVLYLGSTGVGSSNLYNSGSVTATSVTVSGLPSNGETIYARLFWLIGSVWNSANYTYKAK